jgi:uncharacterized protein
MRKILFWRWAFYLFGMLVMALGATMTIKGHRLGIGPWDVLHVGLFNKFGLTIGTWSILLGLTIVTTTAIIRKELPQIGTWLNMLLIGLFIDMFNWMIPEIETLAAQTVIFMFGVVVMSYGAGIYVSPNIGAGPRDSLMLVIVDKFGTSLKKARTIIEIIAALAGWLLGGPVGIGTVIVAIVIGQIVQYSLPQSRTLLLKIIGETDVKVLL